MTKLFPHHLACSYCCFYGAHAHMFCGRARQASTVTSTHYAEYLTCAGHSDWHGSQALGSYHLQELTEGRTNMKTLRLLSWHSVNKGLTFWVSKELICLFSQWEVRRESQGFKHVQTAWCYLLIRVGFSHAYWDKWFRWEKCSWNDPMHLCTFIFLSVKGAYRCVARGSLCPEILPVQCRSLMFSGALLSCAEALNIRCIHLHSIPEELKKNR